MRNAPPESTLRKSIIQPGVGSKHKQNNLEVLEFCILPLYLIDFIGWCLSPDSETSEESKA